jgi:hypothetical protein
VQEARRSVPLRQDDARTQAVSPSPSARTPPACTPAQASTSTPAWELPLCGGLRRVWASWRPSRRRQGTTNHARRAPGHQGTRAPGHQGTREPGNQGTRAATLFPPTLRGSFHLPITPIPSWNTSPLQRLCQYNQHLGRAARRHLVNPLLLDTVQTGIYLEGI